MAGARVTLDGNQIVIRTSDGTRYPSGISIDRQHPDQFEAAIRRAITRASGAAFGNPAHSREITGLSPAREAGRVREQISGAARRAATPRRTTPQPPGRRARGRAARTRAPPGAAARPAISQGWISTQLRNAARGDSIARAAAGAVHAEREAVQAFLGAATGASRTAQQTAATIAVFNALYQLPRFRLYLSSQAATDEQFARLQMHLSDPSRSSSELAADAGASLVTAADSYIRHYLLSFIAHPSGGSPRFRQELDQLPTMRTRLANLQRARTSRAGSADDRRALITQQLSAPMDADTITASILYVRRYTLAHPSRGRGRGEESIAAWQAPEVARREEAPPAARAEAPRAETPPAAPAEPERTPLQRFADANWRNLHTEIYQAIREGRAEALITILRNLPEGHSTLSSALSAAGRDDIARSFDRVFNDFLHTDRQFLAFVRSRSAYTGIARASTRLSEGSSATDRTLIARAVQDFLNFTAGRSDQAWCPRLNQDFRILYRQVLRPPLARDALDVNGQADERTLAALSVYTWRRRNQSAEVGHWARRFDVTPPRQETTPQPAPRPQPEGEGRRRVIRF